MAFVKVLFENLEPEFSFGKIGQTHGQFAASHNHDAAYLAVGLAGEGHQVVDVFAGSGEIQYISGEQAVVAARNYCLMISPDCRHVKVVVAERKFLELHPVDRRSGRQKNSGKYYLPLMKLKPAAHP